MFLALSRLVVGRLVLSNHLLVASHRKQFELIQIFIMEEENKEGDAVVVDTKVQSVLDLLNQHVAGKASNQDVEQAISHLLDKKDDADTSKSRPRKSPRKATKYLDEEAIIEDTENYDDDHADEHAKPAARQQNESPASPGPFTRKRRMVRKSSDLKEPPLDPSLYEGIPLGYQGARMMATFGDGKQPDSKAVAAVLSGARKMLQVAIQDARYLRRQHRRVYANAQRLVGTADRKLPKEENDVNVALSSVDLFRANEGHDPLAKDHKCGFAIGDLQILFPEELNAYMRWNAMNAETEVAKQPEAVVEEDPALEAEIEAGEKAIKDGHLLQRAAQFDVRTERMKDSWYMTYSELRQGSFLPINRRGKLKETEGHISGWGKLKLPAIRFLHWCGFDPNSSLPPPNEDTIDALAFLGYDFVGRIVEKAISIRKYGEKDAVEVLELDINEQLKEEDITKAMEKLKPVPLYTSEPNVNGVKAHPLYFGPGFEQRLEMEIEEFMMDKKLSPEEQDLRRQEDEMFTNLSDQVDPKVFPDVKTNEKKIRNDADDSSEPPPKQKRRRRS